MTSTDNEIVIKKRTKYSKEYLKKLDKKLKFIPLTYDQLFKKVFGNNKKLLKRFLILVLHLDLKENECKIEVGVNELPKEQDNEYGSKIDINVILNKSIKINLEVNREKFEDILERNFLYAAKNHTLNFKEGMDYKKFYKYETIQLNLNTKHYGTEINGEDIFYLKSNNTGEQIVENFKIIIKDLAYFNKLYYTDNEKCNKEEIWLAMLTSKNFSELGAFLEKVVNTKERDEFLEEVVNMCKNEFFVHQWMEEEMKLLVEGKKEYNEEQRRKKFEEEIKKLKEEKKQLKQDFQQEKQDYQQEKQNLQQEKQDLQQEKQDLQQELEKTKQEKDDIIFQTIKSLLKKKISHQDISEITSKSIEEIKEIEKILETK